MTTLDFKHRLGVLRSDVAKLSGAGIHPYGRSSAEREDYAIIRARKLRDRGHIRAVGLHNVREIEVTGADPEGEIRVLIGAGTADGIVADFDDLMTNANGDGKPLVIPPVRKDQRVVPALELVFPAPSREWWEEQAVEMQQRWIDAQLSFLRTILPEQAIISMILHLDEETPNAHAVVVPMDAKESKRDGPHWALSSRIVISGNHRGLSSLQDRYHAHMTECGLDLVRGRPAAETGALNQNAMVLRRLMTVALDIVSGSEELEREARNASAELDNREQMLRQRENDFGREMAASRDEFEDDKATHARDVEAKVKALAEQQAALEAQRKSDAVELSRLLHLEHKRRVALDDQEQKNAKEKERLDAIRLAADDRETKLGGRDRELAAREGAVSDREAVLKQRETSLSERELAIAASEKALSVQQTALKAREAEVDVLISAIKAEAESAKQITASATREHELLMEERTFVASLSDRYREQIAVLAPQMRKQLAEMEAEKAAMARQLEADVEQERARRADFVREAERRKRVREEQWVRVPGLG